MYNPQHDILMLVRHEFMSEQAIEQEVEYINIILQHIGLDHNFCTAHELVTRNRICSDAQKILKASRYQELKAFNFLVNKN